MASDLSELAKEHAADSSFCAVAVMCFLLLLAIMWGL
jgi:hypothetical protein